MVIEPSTVLSRLAKCKVPDNNALTELLEPDKGRPWLSTGHPTNPEL
jgi:hypothetical protein